MIDGVRKVLHVDDDGEVTKLVAAKLGERGFEVISMNDPTGVVEELNRSQIRVVILDIEMPKKSGLELLEEIHNYDGGIQVVILTGMVPVSTLLAAFRQGAEACCFKPVQDVEQLANAVEHCFRKLERWWGSLEELTGRKRNGDVSTIA